MKKIVIFGVLILFAVALISLPQTWFMEFTYNKMAYQFDSWYAENGENYPTTSHAFREWVVQNKEEEFQTLLGNERLLDYVDMELGDLADDEVIPIQKKVWRSKSSEDTSDNGFDIKTINYTLGLLDATKEYVVPWQIYGACDIEKGTAGISDPVAMANYLNRNLQANYFGLYGGEGNPVSLEGIDAETPFTFWKKEEIWIDKTISEYKRVRVRSGEDEDGKPQYDYEWRWVTTTSHTHTYVEYPLPYFTRVESYLEDVDFKYQNELSDETDRDYSESETRKVTTVTRRKIEEPVLIDTVRTPNTRFEKALIGAGMSSDEDGEWLVLTAEKLPYGSRAAEEFGKIFGILPSERFPSEYDYNYDGPIVGDANLDFVLPEINGTPGRSDIVDVGRSLIGLYYFYAGKYDKKGFNPDWGSVKTCTIPTDNGKPIVRSQPYGLDCSGFVAWSYINSIGTHPGGGTSGQIGKSVPISESELRPGDLGFYKLNSKKGINHVGIFIGRDEEGTAMFLHCGGTRWKDANHPFGQVIVSKLGKAYKGYKSVDFKYFRRPIALTSKGL